MLAYSIYGTFNDNRPQIVIGPNPRAHLYPANAQDDSMWFCVLDANNPTGQRVNEFVVPGSRNTEVPPGLQQYIANPGYIVTLATQTLRASSVPQGALYAFLAQYGAGRELQRLEQFNTARGCGQNDFVSYVLSTQGGAYGYEQASDTSPVRYAMSLKGGPPYTLCDAYTFQA